MRATPGRIGVVVGLSLMIRLLLFADTLDKGGDVLGPPHGGAGAELDRLGVTPGAAPLPPRTFADGKNGEDLGKTEKARCGDVGKHTKSSF